MCRVKRGLGAEEFALDSTGSGEPIKYFKRGHDEAASGTLGTKKSAQDSW